MSWRAGLAVMLCLAGAYTSISFLVDSWEGHLCWDSGSTYVRLPWITAFHGATDSLIARINWHSPVAALFELLVLTAFIWPIAALLILDRAVFVISAALLALFPFALNAHDQVTFGVQQFCTNDGMDAIGFTVIQILVILLTMLIFLTAHLADRIGVWFAVRGLTRQRR